MCSTRRSPSRARWATRPSEARGAASGPSGGWGDALSALLHTGRWPFAPGSVIGKVFHVGETQSWFDPAGQVTRVFVEDLTRVVLITVFVLIALLVRKAWAGKSITHDQQEGPRL